MRIRERGFNGFLSALKAYNLSEGIILTQEEESVWEIEEKNSKQQESKE